MTFAGYIEAQCTVPSSTTLSATNNGGGPTTVNITAGTYYLSSLVSHLQTVLNAQRPGSGGATWTVSISLSGSSPTGKVTISMSSGTFSITWSTAALGTLLGHANIAGQTSVTGAEVARGVFIPDRPLLLDGDPRLVHEITDLRETEGPTGLMFGVVGNVKYVHSNLRWAHVSRERYLDTSAGDPSWQRFLLNAHLGQGHAWFSPCSKLKIVDHASAAIGDGFGTVGWRMRGVRTVTARKMSEAWTGAWLIEVPAIVSDGT